MTHESRYPARHRIEVELVEADVEIGFNLVDLAGQELDAGHPTVAARVLHDVDDILQDIEQRLARFAGLEQAPFGPLVAELRREVDAAKTRGSGSGG